MGKETFIAYWNGAEPTGPDYSPTLAQIPDTVDVVILYSVQITEDGNIDCKSLADKNDQATIKGWIEEIRKRQENQPRRTKFLLCIFNDSGALARQDPDTFAQKTRAAVDSWGVDGIDIDIETLGGHRSVISVVQAIKNKLPPGSLLTTPIYSPWEDRKSTRLNSS